jgi:hypothetical protein
MKRKNKKLKAETCVSKNLNLLKRRFPPLWEKIHAEYSSDLVSHKKHFLTEKPKPAINHLQKTKMLLYGDSDPVVSVRKIIDNWNFDPFDLVFIIGIGLGYLPVEAIKKGIGNPRIVIIEPSWKMLRYALACCDLEPLLKMIASTCLSVNDVVLPNIVERYQEKIPVGTNQILVHPNYEKIVGEKIIAINQELSERIRAVRDNWHTTRKYGRQMFKNAVTNLPSLFAGTPLKNLKGKFRGFPAVCVAAGPSLDDAIPELKKIQKQFLIIACDSSVNALLKADIRPHIVVTVDIFESNIEKLKPHFEELNEAVLIYSIESNPDNVRLFLGQKRVAVSAYNKLLLSWIDPAFNLQSQFPAMSSVSHMAIFSAMALGANPIIMVGMDLSYSKGKSHSFDSAFFHSIDHEKLVSTHGNKGFLVSSSPQFISDKLLIEKIVDQSPIRFINTSINGAYVAGTAVKRLNEVADIESPSQLDAGKLLDEIDWKPAADEIAASTSISDLNKKILAFRYACNEKRSKILKDIDRIETESSTSLELEKVAAYETEFEAFQEKNRFFVQMIYEITLSDLQEVQRRKENLSVCGVKKEKQKYLERLKLLAENYELYEKGVDFQINQLKSYVSFAKGVIALKEGVDASRNDWDKHLSLARYFADKGEIWQARREYETCMDLSGSQIPSYVELAGAYIKAGLLKPAKEVIKKAWSLSNDAPEIIHLKNDLETEIDGIFEEIKKEWMQGNMHTTRKILNQYLNLRPDDPQALELKKVIRALDEEFSADSVFGEKEKTVAPDMQSRHKQVVQHIKNKHFEQGVGILEGMTDDFPERGGVFREQIGDIRMMQKDYRSAIWNYRQAMRIDPLKKEIEYKIKKIESLQNLQII